MILSLPRDGPVDLAPKLADLAPAISWLRQHDVPVARLAAIFGADPGHVRQLAFRGRRSTLRFYTPTDSLNGLLARPVQGVRSRLGIRLHEDFGLLTPKRKQKLDVLRADIEAIAADASVPFLARFSALRRLIPFIGYAGDVERIRLLALLRLRLAWLLVHAGYCSSAFSQAQAAINLYHVAYSERGQSDDLRRLAESCLVASNASLLAYDPATSLRFLELARQALERTGDPRGSEHYRQYGVAHFQMRDDESAGKFFLEAVTAMDAKAEAENKAHVLIIGARHLGLIGKTDFDSEMYVLDQVNKDYPRPSLQYSMTLNWAAACGFTADSPTLESEANEMAQQSAAVSASFGHQSTVANLLALTSNLALSPAARRAWVRYALYSNAVRDR